MAIQTVKVKVKTHRRDYIEIRVEPWEVHLAPGDSVQWVAATSNILDLQPVFTKQKRHKVPAWLRKYFGELVIKKSIPTLSRNEFIGRVSVRKHYGLDLVIADPNGGADRTASIDPDMVMDT